MELLGVIKERKSYRSFNDEIPEKEVIDSIFEAARVAASSSNAQAWKYFYAIRGSKEFNLIVDSLAGGNIVWAKNAASLVVSTAAKTYDNGKEYKHAWHDVGLANAQLVLQATHLGYFAHIMGGFDTEQLSNSIQLPETRDAVCVIAVGKQGDGSDLNDVFKERENQERNRKPLDEVASEISL